VRAGIAVLLAIGLAGCAEVTRMDDRSGGDVYMVDCGNTLRLESCRSGMLRACPDGFEILPVPMTSPAGKPVSTVRMFRCGAAAGPLGY
jgi:hypothetical protein